MPLKETIIFAPGANQSDLLKSLAKNNENTFGVRIMNARQLAEYALMRCGIEVEKEFIAKSNEAMLVYDAIKSTRYFNKYMYLDAWKLMESIDNLRYFIRDNDELFQFVNLLPDENFKEKNDTLRFVFSKYLLELSGKHLIDEISYIRKAIRECGAIPDVEIKLLKEFPLKPLEEELFRALTNQEPTYSPLGEPDKKLEITTYTKAFGSSNEVENIIKYILKNKIPFDQCLIVTPESKNYPKLFINYRDLFKFSLKEGVSYSIFETNPGKLLALIMSWSRSIFYKSFFVEMIQDSSFDIERFKFDIKFDENNKEIDEINQRLDYLNKITFEKILDAAGSLRLSFNKEDNDRKYNAYKNSLIDKLEIYKDCQELDDIHAEYLISEVVGRIKEVLNQGTSNFISNYSKVGDDDSVGKDTIKKIVSFLDLSKAYGIPFDEMESTFKSLLAGAETASEGSLFVTTISKAKSILRPYIFILGLSSNYFPGQAKEDSIILDEDYEKFGEIDHSLKEVTRKIEELDSLLSIAKKYAKEIHLSYSTYDAAALKGQSASSVLLKYYREENGASKTLSDFNKEFKKDENSKYKFVEFFDSKIMPDYLIGEASLENKHIALEEVIKEPTTSKILKSIRISGSKIDAFVKCPYSFYLMNVLGIPDEFNLDPYAPMAANEEGNLAHEILSHLDKTKESREEFLKRSQREIDNYFIAHSFEGNATKENFVKNFMKMMENAYDMEENLAPLITEIDLSCVHKETGLKIHGFPDKVFQFPDGRVKIIDYKTKKTLGHFNNDLTSLEQLTLYSYILDNSQEFKNICKAKGIKFDGVDSFEYRYIKINEHVCSEVMEVHYNSLNAVLSDIKICLDIGKFDTNKKSCRFCKFKDICKGGK